MIKKFWFATIFQFQDRSIDIFMHLYILDRNPKTPEWIYSQFNIEDSKNAEKQSSGKQICPVGLNEQDFFHKN